MSIGAASAASAKSATAACRFLRYGQPPPVFGFVSPPSLPPSPLRARSPRAFGLPSSRHRSLSLAVEFPADALTSGFTHSCALDATATALIVPSSPPNVVELSSPTTCVSCEWVRLQNITCSVAASSASVSESCTPSRTDPPARLARFFRSPRSSRSSSVESSSEIMRSGLAARVPGGLSSSQSSARNSASSAAASFPSMFFPPIRFSRSARSSRSAFSLRFCPAKKAASTAAAALRALRLRSSRRFMRSAKSRADLSFS
mmetsp:Transcript_4411/g.20016  ORF Transcript_4411/g.20016 Transcript_4411/m.20016 type:complete len:260 (+) Transcript_4411:1970-2749(+)